MNFEVGKKYFFNTEKYGTKYDSGTIVITSYNAEDNRYYYEIIDGMENWNRRHAGFQPGSIFAGLLEETDDSDEEYVFDCSLTEFLSNFNCKKVVV